MFLGMDLPVLSFPGPWKTYAMLGFVAWHVGAEVVLEIHAYRLSRKGNSLKKPGDTETPSYKPVECDSSLRTNG